MKISIGSNIYGKVRSSDTQDFRLLFSDPELLTKLEDCAVLVGEVEVGGLFADQKWHESVRLDMERLDRWGDRWDMFDD